MTSEDVLGSEGDFKMRVEKHGKVAVACAGCIRQLLNLVDFQQINLEQVQEFFADVLKKVS
jgi:hypothetical protein